MESTNAAQKAPRSQSRVRVQSKALRPVVRNRRGDDRRPFEVTVDYDSDHCFYTGFSENISSGGLFVATPDPLPLGTSIRVTFTIPTYDRPVRCLCEVRWVRESSAADPYVVSGMGVRFSRIGPVEERAINKFLSRRDTLFFEED